MTVPPACILYWTALIPPNRIAPNTALTGFHPEKITKALTIHPRLPVIFSDHPGGIGKGKMYASQSDQHTAKHGICVSYLRKINPHSRCDTGVLANRLRRHGGLGN